jgi:hypothetical protein
LVLVALQQVETAIKVLTLCLAVSLLLVVAMAQPIKTTVALVALAVLEVRHLLRVCNIVVVQELHHLFRVLMVATASRTSVADLCQQVVEVLERVQQEPHRVLTTVVKVETDYQTA